MRISAWIALLCLLPATPVFAGSGNDDYAAMLQYLTNSRIDGHAVSNASGAISVNIASGDLNAQANLHAIAVGDVAVASINASALRAGNRGNAPDVATASIGGHAFSGTQGLISINQASGTGNAEMNAVAVTLARLGIRETSSEQWLADAAASNGGQAPASVANARTRVRSVAVESTAMEGTSGVVQLNQVAGSGNATANVLTLGVSPHP